MSSASGRTPRRRSMNSAPSDNVVTSRPRRSPRIQARREPRITNASGQEVASPQRTNRLRRYEDQDQGRKNLFGDVSDTESIASFAGSEVSSAPSVNSTTWQGEPGRVTPPHLYGLDPSATDDDFDNSPAEFLQSPPVPQSYLDRRGNVPQSLSPIVEEPRTSSPALGGASRQSQSILGRHHAVSELGQQLLGKLAYLSWSFGSRLYLLASAFLCWDVLLIVRTQEFLRKASAWTVTLVIGVPLVLASSGKKSVAGLFSNVSRRHISIAGLLLLLLLLPLVPLLLESKTSSEVGTGLSVEDNVVQGSEKPFVEESQSANVSSPPPTKPTHEPSETPTPMPADTPKPTTIPSLQKSGGTPAGCSRSEVELLVKNHVASMRAELLEQLRQEQQADIDASVEKHVRIAEKKHLPSAVSREIANSTELALLVKRVAKESVRSVQPMITQDINKDVQGNVLKNMDKSEKLIVEKVKTMVDQHLDGEAKLQQEQLQEQANNNKKMVSAQLATVEKEFKALLEKRLREQSAAIRPSADSGVSAAELKEIQERIAGLSRKLDSATQHQWTPLMKHKELQDSVSSVKSGMEKRLAVVEDGLKKTPTKSEVEQIATAVLSKVYQDEAFKQWLDKHYRFDCQQLKACQKELKALWTSTDIEKLITSELAKQRRDSKEVSVSGSVNRQMVEGIVKSALEQYSADRTGRFDYALESAGGSVYLPGCADGYDSGARVRIYNIPLWAAGNSPKTIIQPDVLPGSCWPFAGSKGNATIKLAAAIEVTSVTVEHVPSSMAHGGDLSSAPKDFLVVALQNEDSKDGIVLGNFSYTLPGPPLQHFQVETTSVPFPVEYIRFAFLSNHGNVKYTCIYRLRVHGNKL